MTAAILRCGVHIPRLRLARATIAEAMAWTRPAGARKPRGSRAIGNWDEDALTMAVEAARSCVGEPPYPPQAARLIFCSTTAPFADRDDAVMIAAALALPETTDTLNVSASLRAGTRALLSALRAGERALIVASDARLTRPGSAEEQSYGDGAAAVMIGPEAPGALATVLGTYTLASDFVDHYRMSGARFDYAMEERWIRDESLLKIVPAAIASLLSAADVRADSVRHFVAPVGAAVAARLAQACGLDTALRDERVLLECGNAGAALPLLQLAAALETAQPGELIVVLGLGQGVDALLLRARAAEGAPSRPLEVALAQRREETSYVRYLSHRALLEVDFGMRAERDQRTAQSVAYRKRGALSAFVGARCDACGTVQFPQSRVCVNPPCRATDSQSPYRLADSRGRVKTFTEDWQAYAARPPYIYGNVEFAEGGNLFMEFTDLEAGELTVDDTVRFVYRIKDEDRTRAFRRYFWKATKI